MQPGSLEAWKPTPEPNVNASLITGPGQGIYICIKCFDTQKYRETAQSDNSKHN